MRFRRHLILLAALILTLVSGAAAAAEGLRLGLMATTDTTPIEVRVDGHLFVIPHNYFLHPPRRDGVEDDGFLLQVLLPDLEPYTADNAEEFRRGGFGRTMSILLEGGQRVRPLDQLFNYYLGGAAPKLPSDATFGLFHAIDRYGDDVFAYWQARGIHTLIKCNPVEPNIDADCRHLFTWYSFDVRLNYSRNYLIEWRNIQKSVEIFFSTIVRDGSTLTTGREKTHAD